LVFGTRGISFQHRHLMKDIIKMLPHAKSANKMERKENLFVVNEVRLLTSIVIVWSKLFWMFFNRCVKCHTVISVFYLMGDFKGICTCGLQILLMGQVLSLM